MSETLTERDIAAWIDWLTAAGIEEHAGERPTDWLELTRQQAAAAAARSTPQARAPQATPRPAQRAPVRAEPARPATLPAPARPARPAGLGDAQSIEARSAAKTAQTLPELLAILKRFEGCGLKATAKNLCFFRGMERSRLMLIGEAPGRDEDLSGVPFVGPAGQLLDRMLAAIGLTERDVHITNSVYWRPPGNRTPSPQETQACRPFLDRQIELVAPEIIVLLGGAAANTVLGVQGGIMRLRGTWKEIEAGGRKIKALPTLHPAFLLRAPANKRQAWRDMLAIAEALERAG